MHKAQLPALKQRQSCPSSIAARGEDTSLPWFGSSHVGLRRGPAQLPENCSRCCCRSLAESAVAAGEEEGEQPGRGRAESLLGSCTGMSGMTHGVGKWPRAALLYPKGSPRLSPSVASTRCLGAGHQFLTSSQIWLKSRKSRSLDLSPRAGIQQSQPAAKHNAA